jgi:mRNA-degrading endonuclease RelE of RelBE toxin-antitoxin system
VPADRLNLTDEERGLLPNPNWVTEDDADFIIGIRRERADSLKSTLHGIYFFYSLPPERPPVHGTYAVLSNDDDRVKVEAAQAIQYLAEDPLPEGSVELHGHPKVYRIRCCRGSYSIVYRVSAKQRKVIVLRVRPRASAYQGL